MVAAEETVLEQVVLAAAAINRVAEVEETIRTEASRSPIG